MIRTRHKMPDDILKTNIDWLNAAINMGITVVFKLNEGDSPQKNLDLTAYVVDGLISIVEGEEFANQRVLLVPTMGDFIKLRESKVFYVQMGVKP